MKRQIQATILTGHLLKILLMAAPFILEYFGGAKMGVHRYLLYIRYNYPDSLLQLPGPGAWLLLGLTCAGCLVTAKMIKTFPSSPGVKAAYFAEGALLLGLVAGFIGYDLFRTYKAYPFFAVALGSAGIVHIAETWLTIRLSRIR
ncbi:MAG TPA: hypothetical protein PKA10_08170 [Selenomonadales bacterium]|nr:hypothetical protein [Selenomonadales bacterium]